MSEAFDVGLLPRDAYTPVRYSDSLSQELAVMSGDAASGFTGTYTVGVAN